MIKFSDAPAIILAFYRVFLAAILLFMLRPAVVIDGLRRVNRRDMYLTAWSGLFLALHFCAWIEALNHTTIANAVTLTDSAPIFALVLSHFFLKESASPIAIAGLFAALAGAVAISWGDFSADPQYFYGDMLAIAGAVTSAAYLVCGRIVRSRLELTAFSVLVYGFAAFFLMSWCIFFEIPLTGYSLRNYAIFIGLAVLPTIGGHSLFQYLLRYMKAYLVNLGFLGEPIGAAILAYIVFHEVPAWYFYLGGTLIIAGCIMALWSEGEKKLH